MIKKRKEIRAKIHKTNKQTDRTENNKIKKEIDIAIGKKVKKQIYQKMWSFATFSKAFLEKNQ